MSTPLRPQHFCSRPSGILTPLVAVDELPSHISIRGVPRVLSPADTQGMTSLGAVAQRNQVYVVDIPGRSVSANTSGRGREYELQSSLARHMSDDTIPANQRLAVQTMVPQGPARAQNWALPKPNPASNGWMAPSIGGACAGGAAGQKNPSSNSKKEYCSYWIRHGECDYQQQGCLFKHEMPTDPSMLEKLGLRDIPRWYRDKYNVPSLLANSHRPQANYLHGQPWREEPTVKAIQYPSRMGINDGFHATESDKAPKPNAPNFVPQHGGAIPDKPRAYAAMNQPKGPPPMLQNNGPKPITNQHNPHDLLSFDPVRDYASRNQMASSTVGELTYPPTTTTTAEQVLPIEAPAGDPRDGFVRTTHSLMPVPMAPTNADRMQDPVDMTPCPVRSKRTQPQQTRRLYEHRSFPAPQAQEAEDSFTSWKGLRRALPSLPKVGSHPQMPMPMSMQMGSSALASPTTRGVGVGIGIGGGMLGSTISSDSATRPASPAGASRSSLSSHSSENLYFGDKEKRARRQLLHRDPFHHPPGAIGTRPVPRKEFGAADGDLMGFGGARR